jgi:hypothetical protein
VDAPAEGLGLGRLVGTVRAREPHAEAGPGCDPERVAEGDAPVHYQDGGVEEPGLETDRGQNASDWTQQPELARRLGKAT